MTVRGVRVLLVILFPARHDADDVVVRLSKCIIL